MKAISFQMTKLSGLLDSASDIISNAVARLIYAAQELLALGRPGEPDLETRAAVARSKTVIGELEEQRRADDSKATFQRGA